MPVNQRNNRIYLAIVIAFSALVYLLSPILAPFLIAAFLSYLGDPLVDRLHRRGLSRTLGVIIVFLGMTLLGLLCLLVAAPLIEGQIRIVIRSIPQLGDWINTAMVPFLESISGLTIPTVNVGTLTAAAAKHWNQLGGVVGVLAGWLGSSTQVMLSWIAFATIVPVVTFYLLRDWDVLLAKINQLIPRQFEPKITALAREVDESGECGQIHVSSEVSWWTVSSPRMNCLTCRPCQKLSDSLKRHSGGSKPAIWAQIVTTLIIFSVSHMTLRSKKFGVSIAD